MANEISNFLGLTNSNIVEDLTIVRKIMELDAYFKIEDIKLFLNEYLQNLKTCYRSNLLLKVISNIGNVIYKEIVPLIDIFLDTNYFEKILSVLDGDIYLHRNVIKHYIENFEGFSLNKFICSDLYLKIICKNSNYSEDFITQINVSDESKIDQELNKAGSYNLGNVNFEEVKRIKFENMEKVKESKNTNTFDIKNNTKDNSNSYKKQFNINAELKEMINTLVIMIMNKFHADLDLEELLLFIPSERLVEVKLNKNTFCGILKKSNDVSRFMAYEIEKIEESDEIERKILNDAEFCKEIINYIKSQELINTTILITAIFINFHFFENLFSGSVKNNLMVKNINFKKILFLVKKQYLLKFDNDFMKNKMMEHILDQYFELELFLFCITKETIIDYNSLVNIQECNFSCKELFLLYFIEKLKFKTKEVDNFVIEDVKQIIRHEIYDSEVLEYIFKNNVDYGLFDKKCLEILSLSEFEYKNHNDLFVEKYFRKLVKYNINYAGKLFSDYKKIVDFLTRNYELIEEKLDSHNKFSKKNDTNTEDGCISQKNNKIFYEQKMIKNQDITIFKEVSTIKLPILKTYNGFTIGEKIFILRYYIAKQIDINKLIILIIELFENDSKFTNEIEDFIIKNIEKIEEPKIKIHIVIMFRKKIKNCDDIIENEVIKLKKKDKEYIIKNMKDLNALKIHFYRIDHHTLSISQGAVDTFFLTLNNHLETLEDLVNFSTNKFFIKNYLLNLFKNDEEMNKYDTKTISEYINQIILKILAELNILNEENRYNADTISDKDNLKKEFIINKSSKVEYHKTHIANNIKLDNNCFQDTVNLTKDILNICIGFYINKILHNNDFLQVDELHLTRDFLNYLYMFMLKFGKDLGIYKKCEQIILKIKGCSNLLEIEVVIKNIKSLK